MAVNPQTLVTPAASKWSTRDAITWAIGLSLFINVVGLFGNLLPGMGDIPSAVYVVGSVFVALSILGAWGMWERTRWGYRLTFTVTVVNTLLGIGAFSDSPSPLLVAFICLGFVLGAWFVWIMRRADVRAAIGGAAA